MLSMTIITLNFRVFVIDWFLPTGIQKEMKTRSFIHSFIATHESKSIPREKNVVKHDGKNTGVPRRTTSSMIVPSLFFNEFVPSFARFN